MSKIFSGVFLLIIFTFLFHVSGDNVYRAIFNVSNVEAKTSANIFTCVDSDHGKNIKIFGITSNDIGWHKRDVCVDSNNLTEFYCEDGTGKVLSQNFTCVGRCQNGECIDRVIPISETSKNIKKNGDISHDFVSSSKKPENKKSYMIFYLNIFLFFLGLLVTKYANYVQKTDGGVSLYQRLIGPFIIFASILSIILFFSKDSSVFLMFSFVVFVIRLIVSANKNVNDLYTAKMKTKVAHIKSGIDPKNKYYNN